MKRFVSSLMSGPFPVLAVLVLFIALTRNASSTFYVEAYADGHAVCDEVTTVVGLKRSAIRLPMSCRAVNALATLRGEGVLPEEPTTPTR